MLCAWQLEEFLRWIFAEDDALGTLRRRGVWRVFGEWCWFVGFLFFFVSFFDLGGCFFLCLFLFVWAGFVSLMFYQDSLPSMGAFRFGFWLHESKQFTSQTPWFCWIFTEQSLRSARRDRLLLPYVVWKPSTALSWFCFR